MIRGWTLDSAKAEMAYRKMDSLLFVVLLLSVIPYAKPATCKPNLHCSQICKPYQQDEAISTEPPCIQLDVNNIRPIANTNARGKCLIVTISRDPTKCSLNTFVTKSPKSYALQAVARDGYPVGGFYVINLDRDLADQGLTDTEYNRLEAVCIHDTDEVKRYNTEETKRTVEKCPAHSGFTTDDHVSQHFQ